MKGLTMLLMEENEANPALMAWNPNCSDVQTMVFVQDDS